MYLETYTFTAKMPGSLLKMIALAKKYVYKPKLLKHLYPCGSIRLYPLIIVMSQRNKNRITIIRLTSDAAGMKFQGRQCFIFSLQFQQLPAVIDQRFSKNSTE